MRKALVLGTAAASILAVAAAGPASADTTNATFELTAGSLSIDAPATASLGRVASSTTASTLTGQLGTTTVTDTRGSLTAAYQVLLTSGNFTTGTAGATETILGSTVTSMSGAVTHTNTTATKVATETTVPVGPTVPIMGLSAYSGNDSATYNPTVVIPVPVTNVAGTYTGVVTQTVVAL